MIIDRAKRSIGEFSWIVVGQGASVLGGLVLVRVLTKHLDPKQYGELALGLTIAGLVNQVVMGGVTAGIARFYSVAAENGDLSGYLFASRRLMYYAMFAVAAIGFLLLTGLWILGYSRWMGLAAATLILSLLSGCSSSLNGIQNAARQRAIVAFHNGLDVWLKLLLALGALLWLGQSSTAVVIGYALSSLLVNVSQLAFLRRMLRQQLTLSESNLGWERQMWAYSWPFSTWGVFSWAQQCSDRWALNAYTTTHEVGLYSVVFQLGYTSISLATGLALSFLGPILFQRSGNAKDHARNASVHQLVWRITLTGILITFGGFVSALALHRWIFGLLVDAQYLSVSYLLPWMVLAGGLFAAGQMLSLKMMSEMKPEALTRVKITTSILGVFLNVFFASVGGILGVVAALVISSAIYLVWMVVLTLKNPITIVPNSAAP